VPHDWARVQMNMGNTLGDRIKGIRADNLERALECYTDALQVRTREVVPVYWANVQWGLGVAFMERIDGDRADNLEHSISSYRNALQVITSETMPQESSDIAHNLEIALAEVNALTSSQAPSSDRVCPLCTLVCPHSAFAAALSSLFSCPCLTRSRDVVNLSEDGNEN
jgi:hypothetical protein